MARNMNPLMDQFQMVDVKHHEGSTIFTYEGESELPYEMLQETLTNLIDRVQKEIDRQDGFVGHIKAFAEDEGASAVFSATGYEIHVKQGKKRVTKIGVAAIVFITEEEPILEIIEEAIASLS